ncbi:MAG TPA: hypothetical protein VEO54_20715 [Thermoanaerobaculia bacterium]|nr:hypothetical protein [Thermoanaerobaculia bacterium]
MADTQVNDDRLYRTLDRLLEHKTAIETRIRARLSELFAIEYDLLLYDVTSTFFEGLCTANAMAKRGHVATSGLTANKCASPWWLRARVCRCRTKSS